MNNKFDIFLPLKAIMFATVWLSLFSNSYATQDIKVPEDIGLLPLISQFIPPGWEIAWETEPSYRDNLGERLAIARAPLNGGRSFIMVLGKKGETYNIRLSSRRYLPYFPVQYDAFRLVVFHGTGSNFTQKYKDLARGDLYLLSFRVDDINRDNRKDILIHTFSGGSGGYQTLRIFTYPHGMITTEEFITIFNQGGLGFEITNLDDGGIKEIVVDHEIQRFYRWRDIYKWNGIKYTQQNELFPQFYDKLIKKYADDSSNWAARLIIGRAFEVKKVYKKAIDEYELALELLAKDKISYEIYNEDILKRINQLKSKK